jgi:hypothetical protein
MSTHPAPRPALQKAPDGSVHPASPRLSSLAVVVGEPGRLPGPRSGPPAADPKGKDRGKGGKKARRKAAPPVEETTELVVTLPKSVRKQLRRRAAEYGWTAEEAGAHVLRVWAEH